MSSQPAAADGEATDEPECFADGTPLVELLGDTPRARILEVLVADRQYDLSITELARQAGVSRKTVYNHIDDLVEMGAAWVSRETPQGKRYTLADTDVGQKLYELEGVALQQMKD
jgi:DNA-binding IclR family transcriptional regulator